MAGFAAGPGQPHYIGRFAPSPTGPLHAGSLVAALGSWLDARAHGGQWLVRMEDVDTPRCSTEAGHTILRQLAACGLVSDAPLLWQSTRNAAYADALTALQSKGLAYACACSRSDIEAALAASGHTKPRHGELIYPGTCRNGLQGRPGRAWRFKTEFLEKNTTEASVKSSFVASNSIANENPDTLLHWHDRRLGPQQQCVQAQVGDFVLQRADGLWAYQLAVVVDDAAQGITHVVRGADLADNTARQILLQRALGLPTPQYLHLPLVRAADGQKLSKQNGAQALDVATPNLTTTALRAAASALGLSPSQSTELQDALADYAAQWRVSRHLQSPAVTDTTTPTPAAAPSDSAQATHRPIRSYVRRAGRSTDAQARAMATVGPRFVLPFQTNAIDLIAAYDHSTQASGGLSSETGRKAAPIILEIGFGMGEATAHIAAVLPEKNFLCCEVHEPGIGALLKRIEERQLTNIRIIAHDAVEVLEHMLTPGMLDGVHIFFPDPWHKKRHNKRRLIQAPLIARLASRIKPGGYLHCATDWQPYAEQILQVLSDEPTLANTAPDYAPKPDYRPLTKFENRGLKLGHGVWDLVFTKRVGM